MPDDDDSYSSSQKIKRRRVWYSSQKSSSSSRKLKKGDRIIEIQSILENETQWFLVYRNNSIESGIFIQRIKLFSWIFGICFNIFLLIEALIGELPAIILFIEAFAILVLVSIFPNFRKSKRIVHEIYLDENDLFVKARFITPWSVIRNRYSAKDDSNLLGYGLLLSPNKISSYQVNIKWKEKDWSTSLEIPITHYEIVDYPKAQKLFSDFNLSN